MKPLFDWLSSPAASRLAGIAALATLLGTGTLAVEVGLPLLTALAGYHVAVLANSPKP